MIADRKEGQDEYFQEWRPRKPYKRTLKQWAVFLVYKLGLIKPYKGPYECPVCGDYHDDGYPSDTQIRFDNYSYCYAMSCEWGGRQHTWEETHQCEHCGAVYSFDNGSV